jgi:hypothetical protein
MSKTFAAAKNRRNSQRYILAAAYSRRKRTHIKQKKNSDKNKKANVLAAALSRQKQSHIKQKKI